MGVEGGRGRLLRRVEDTARRALARGLAAFEPRNGVGFRAGFDEHRPCRHLSPAEAVLEAVEGDPVIAPRPFHTAGLLGVAARIHRALFEEIHEHERRTEDREAIAALFERHGAAEGQSGSGSSAFD